MNPIEMRNRSIAIAPIARRRVWFAVVTFSAAVLLSSVAFAGPPASDGGTDKVVKKVRVVAESGKPFLGINMEKLDADVLKGLDASVKKGVVITRVVEGSPADEAGLEDGDIVILFDRKEVGSPDELKELVGNARVGDTVGVKVVRSGEPRSFKVTIGEWPDDESVAVIAPEAFHWMGDGKNLFQMNFGRGRLGVQVAELNEGLAPYFGVEEGGGVLVLDVVEGSAAAKMGVKAGDVIRRIDGEKVGSVEELVDAVGDLESGKKFELGLVRAKKGMTLEGEAAENPVDVYVKALGRGKDGKGPKIEKFYMKDFSDSPGVDTKQMKKEMDELKKELQKVREELDKIKESA
jgi:C-terminal processing protease CtpA/Prc